jgi:hypothetical protein
MNDVNWRLMDDETWSLIERHPNSHVLVETEVTFRITSAKSITDDWKHGPWYEGAHETVKRIAFI